MSLASLRPRIIPCLLMKGGGLVKTVGFGDPKYVGDPINAVRIFNEKEADELMVLDVDATREGRPPSFDLIGRLAMECRMPLAYGGGVRTPDDARRITRLGVEKVSVSAAAVADPALVTRMADEVGSQSVVVVLDARRRRFRGGWEVQVANGTRGTGREVTELARECQERGGGEIVVNSVDRDGRMDGYDLELARAVRSAVSIPLTILGGAGRLEHLADLVAACGIVGAAAGSLFVFKGAYRAVLINYPTMSEREALLSHALRRHREGAGG